MLFSRKYTRKKPTTIILFCTVSLWEDFKFFSISIIRFLSLRRNDGTVCVITHISQLSLHWRRIPSSLLSFWLTLWGTVKHVKHRDFVNQSIHSIEVTYNCGSLSFDYMPLQEREKNTMYSVRKKKLGRNFHRFNQWTNIIISLPF